MPHSSLNSVEKSNSVMEVISSRVQLVLDQSIFSTFTLLIVLKICSAKAMLTKFAALTGMKMTWALLVVELTATHTSMN